jgi:hypothetical protein
MKQHSDDYKLSAVMYYINHNEDLRDTCDIFKCKYQSLHRWCWSIERYMLQHCKETLVEKHAKIIMPLA